MLTKCLPHPPPHPFGTEIFLNFTFVDFIRIGTQNFSWRTLALWMDFKFGCIKSPPSHHPQSKLRPSHGENFAETTTVHTRVIVSLLHFHCKFSVWYSGKKHTSKPQVEFSCHHFHLLRTMVTVLFPFIATYAFVLSKEKWYFRCWHIHMASFTTWTNQWSE